LTTLHEQLISKNFWQHFAPPFILEPPFKKLWLRACTPFVHSKNLTNKKQNIFFDKQKGFRDGLSYSTPQKSEETRGNAITQPQSQPISMKQAMVTSRKIKSFKKHSL